MPPDEELREVFDLANLSETGTITFDQAFVVCNTGTLAVRLGRKGGGGHPLGALRVCEGGGRCLGRRWSI